MVCLQRCCAHPAPSGPQPDRVRARQRARPPGLRAAGRHAQPHAPADAARAGCAARTGLVQTRRAARPYRPARGDSPPMLQQPRPCERAQSRNPRQNGAAAGGAYPRRSAAPETQARGVPQVARQIRKPARLRRSVRGFARSASKLRSHRTLFVRDFGCARLRSPFHPSASGCRSARVSPWRSEKLLQPACDLFSQGFGMDGS